MYYNEGYDTGAIATHLEMVLHHLQAVRSIRDIEIDNEHYGLDDSPEPHHISRAEDAFIEDTFAKIDDLRSRVIDRTP